MMIFNLSTAFVMFHRQEILMAEEFILPQTMTNLTLKRKEDVYDVFVRAIELRKSTPYSFQHFVVNERIFSPLIDSEELEALLFRIEKLPALPLTMSELLFYCFPGKIQCCNPFCKNGLHIKNSSNIQTVTTTKRVVHSPLAGFSTGNNKRKNNEGNSDPYRSSAKMMENTAGTVRSVVKDPGLSKNIGAMNSSLDNSPGKLMDTFKSGHSQKYKPPKQSPPFGQTVENTRKSGSPKTWDYTNLNSKSED